MKLSVALCTYNGEKYIKEQIDSILNQTLKIDEIVICDDRSTDSTISILEEYAIHNPNIFKIHINEENLRSVKNFEKAIKLCDGDIIFLSDQDDIWVDKKVADYVSYFINNPSIDVLASNGFCIDENSEIHEKYAIWDVPEILKNKEVKFNYYNLITNISNIATGASMAIRSSLKEKIFPFPVLKDFHHDEWIAIISSKLNSFEILNEKYFYYRLHSNQQVGGVFFDKTNERKEMLYKIFDIHGNEASFKHLKKRLKKIDAAYKRNARLYKTDNIYKEWFKENLIIIETSHKRNSKIMKLKYPFKKFLLFLTDKILNKRQFKSIH